MMDRPSDDLDVLLRVSCEENREEEEDCAGYLVWESGYGRFFIEGYEAMLNGICSSRI